MSVNLIVGATGSLGGRVTRGLLQQGKDVRILTRKNPISEELAKQGRANTAQSLIEAGAQAVTGDLKHRAALDAACQGVETVIATATATQRGGEDTIESVDLHGMLNLIAAARAAGVKRFLYTSVPGAAPYHPIPLMKIKEPVRPPWNKAVWHTPLCSRAFSWRSGSAWWWACR